MSALGILYLPMTSSVYAYWMDSEQKEKGSDFFIRQCKSPNGLCLELRQVWICILRNSRRYCYYLEMNGMRNPSSVFNAVAKPQSTFPKSSEPCPFRIAVDRSPERSSRISWPWSPLADCLLNCALLSRSSSPFSLSPVDFV